MEDVKIAVPNPPPVPSKTISHIPKALAINDHVSTAARDLWDRIFDEGKNADVVIHTDNGGTIYAHASIIGTASPVMKGMLKQAKKCGRWQSISIRGVPVDAVRAFVRFLYSSCYEKQDMEEFSMALLVLAHVYMVPHLKRLCEWHLEHDLLTVDNAVDVFQLALLCDAPRLGFVSHRMILRNLKCVSDSEGWAAMKRSHPRLEKDLLASMTDEENVRKVRIKKLNEKKVYSQLYEAMEALVHICKDGCKTIGPHDKDLKGDQAQCHYTSCKGLESLVRHLAGCRLRAPGGCVHCKRMWQLLELHSRLCVDSEQCRVPLCRSFKERTKKQNKKDEMRWKLLVKNVLNTKRIRGSPYFVCANY